MTYDEYHRGAEPAVPADHEKQAIFHQRRFPVPDVIFGLAADHEALARPLPKLGSGAQPTGADVPLAGHRISIIEFSRR